MVFARRVRLVAHYEMAAPDDPTWWAESADLPGFTAVYSSLGELQREAVDAVHFALETDDVAIEWEGADDAPRWAAAHIEFHQPEFLAEERVSRRPNNITVGTTPAEISTVTGVAVS